MSDDKGWKPRRFGKIFYCSPRCGAHCTRAAFETATRRAKALCKRLGPGWEPKVWENMGWFYSAQKGVTEVHANHHHSYKGGVSYSVYFNSAHQFVTSDRDPKEALRVATNGAKLMIRKLKHDIAAVAA